MADNEVMNSEEYMEEDDLGSVILTLDDDTELECSILCIYPVGDKEYIALLPMNDLKTSMMMMNMMQLSMLSMKFLMKTNSMNSDSVQKGSV